MEEETKDIEKRKTFDDWYNEEFTEATNEKSRKRLKLLIILTPIALAFDVLMSYWAYIRNPGFFINHEISDSFITLITTGDFPHILALANVFGIFLMCFGYILIKNKKMKFKSVGDIYIFIGIVMVIGHIYGGFSWLPTIMYWI